MTVINEKQNRKLAVKEADNVEILSLIDNSVDFLSAIKKEQVQSFRQWKREREGKESGPRCRVDEGSSRGTAADAAA